MGNRAVITASLDRVNGTGVYIHWNGGIESVSAFLEVCRRRGYRDPSQDESYAMARLVGVLCEFFGDGLSVGIGPLCRLDCDNYDNGVYVIGAGWRINETWGEGSDPLSPLKCDPVRLKGPQLAKFDGIVAQLMKGAE